MKCFRLYVPKRVVKRLSEFEIKGLNELEDSLKKAVNAYPDKAASSLKALGNQFKRKAIKNTDQAQVKEHTGRLKKGYKVSKVTGYGMNMEVNFSGTAPHFHLIEHGHNQINKKGENIGFVPGYHMVAQTRTEFQDEVPKQLQKMISKINKECGLD